MTDPNEYVAGQIRQQAQDVKGTTASPEELAQAAQATSGLGVTEADLEAIMAQLAQFKARLDAQEQAQRKATPDTLRSSVAALVTQLANHGDQAAIELGKDAVEAAETAAGGGAIAPLANIAEKLAKHLIRHPAGPGDQFHYRQVLDTAQTHIPDVIDAFQPPSDAQAIGSDRAPAKVLQGSVVG